MKRTTLTSVDYDFDKGLHYLTVSSSWTGRGGGHLFITEYEMSPELVADYVFMRKLRQAKRTARKKHLAALRRYKE
ncbi:hypothetical protein [Stenotrophomonas phage c9-N]|uniref:Uncharacterized protein n=1 Tax=Stenotrophomonas phage vB_SmeS_BUCT700 TaxID=2924895 RepID=A0AAE9GD15_9CAUD|nr:hypothetical protein [Stenotrophomonas phage vB_SmeS_BUCT700]UNY50284.1 hypothetical protein [Stenotrophomonas phage vB_SmeS_BUCT703]WKC56415.1 hypothetical protein [Stenotrophomonas phage c9-N]